MAELSEFVPFRFKVSLYRSDSNELLCAGSFSEVTGFELTMEPRVIKEGGLNWGEHQRSGPTKFSPINQMKHRKIVNCIQSLTNCVVKCLFSPPKIPL